MGLSRNHSSVSWSLEPFFRVAKAPSNHPKRFVVLAMVLQFHIQSKPQISSALFMAAWMKIEETTWNAKKKRVSERFPRGCFKEFKSARSPWFLPSSCLQCSFDAPVVVASQMTSQSSTLEASRIVCVNIRAPNRRGSCPRCQFQCKFRQISAA